MFEATYPERWHLLTFSVHFDTHCLFPVFCRWWELEWYLMSSCVRNSFTKNYSNLVIFRHGMTDDVKDV